MLTAGSQITLPAPVVWKNITDNVIFDQIYELWLAEVDCCGGENELFEDVAVPTQKEKTKHAGFSRG